ncbi:class I SAM-dependent methyltransferase [Candidatus Bipolaricaulota bacterium]|nr:class I SAM-dependent methyltransferase [Candidatus Bipolaricaulota bacterium]
MNKISGIVMRIKKKILDIGYSIINSRFLSKLFTYKVTWELAAITKSTAMEAILKGVGNEDEFWSSGRKTASRLMNFVNRNSVVLDVGCGIGRVERYLAPYCKEIFGVDISRRKIAKKSLKNHENVHFIKNNGRDLSIFENNKFDFIFSILVLQHLEKEDAYNYIKEMYRVLKPKGTIYLQFPNLLSEEYFKTFVDYAEKGSRHATRVRCYTLPEVEKILSSIGFKDLEITTDGKNIIAIAKKP